MRQAEIAFARIREMERDSVGFPAESIKFRLFFALESVSALANFPTRCMASMATIGRRQRAASGREYPACMIDRRLKYLRIHGTVNTGSVGRMNDTRVG